MFIYYTFSHPVLLFLFLFTMWNLVDFLSLIYNLQFILCINKILFENLFHILYIHKTISLPIFIFFYYFQFFSQIHTSHSSLYFSRLYDLLILAPEKHNTYMKTKFLFQHQNVYIK